MASGGFRRIVQFVPLLMLAAVAAAPVSSAVEAPVEHECFPPCGPIPVFVSFEAERSKKVLFDESGKFETKGKLVFTWDIDNDGYAYDAQQKVEVVTKISRTQPWVKVAITPNKFPIPLKPSDCPTCIKQDGDPPNLMYLYETPFTLTIEKVRDPSPAELKRATKSDGTYRVMVSGTSNESKPGTPEARPAGLDAGYGLVEVSFISPKEILAAASGLDTAAGAAPGLEAATLVGLLAVVAYLRRR